MENEMNITDAHKMAKKQQDIGVAEFFARNRHLLGFDNKRKALLTTVKEALDNGLDACEEASILPEVIVDIIDLGNDRFRIIIEDNGPGILKNQIPKIFARLLYGSKFFKLSQSRGQQGIGISAAVMYGQLTTGKAAKITSKIGQNEKAHYYELMMDTQKNKPEIVKEGTPEWNKEHGTKIELEIEASYMGGSQSIDEYIKQTAIVNPHVTLIYTNPKAEQFVYARAAEQNPKKPVEIKPHPYGVELGVLQRMLKQTDKRTLQAFLTEEFSRVGAGTAKEICENSALLPNTKPSQMTRELVERLVEGIKKTRIISPPTDCISPIGAALLEKGLRKEINAEFYCAATRPPSVYRGNPFVVEAGIAYGGDQSGEDSARVLRYANRVPLQYQQGACAITKSVISTSWKNYGLSQSKGSFPIGPLTIVVSISSVWVPFTSESKEAIAHYPEIIKDIKLALQEVGRKLYLHVHRKKQVQNQLERANLFEKYIPEVADSLSRLTGESKEKLLEKMREMTKKEDIQAQFSEMKKLKGEVEKDTKLSDDNEEQEEVE